MRPLITDPLHGVIFTLVVFWAFFPEMRLVWRAKKAEKASTMKDPSLRTITFLSGAAWWLAFLAAFRMPRLGMGGQRELLFWIGAAVLIGGSLMRRLCWRVLGEYFTGNVTVQERQPVVDTGPYRFIRHPSYTAAMLMLVGIALMLGNWGSLLVFIVLPLIAYGHRMVVEERALAGSIGQPYVEYMQRTKRLVPWVI